MKSVCSGLNTWTVGKIIKEQRNKTFNGGPQHAHAQLNLTVRMGNDHLGTDILVLKQRAYETSKLQYGSIGE